MSFTEFRELSMRTHAIACSKGWWSKDDLSRVSHGDVELTATKLMLISTEIAEAMECLRDGDMDVRMAENGKPEGFVSELADIVIRTMDLSEAMGFDLCAAVMEKMSYNETRSHRHGGKLA